HEFGNAGWEDLVNEFQAASGKTLGEWSRRLILQRGAPFIRVTRPTEDYCLEQTDVIGASSGWFMRLRVADDRGFANKALEINDLELFPTDLRPAPKNPLEK